MKLTDKQRLDDTLREATDAFWAAVIDNYTEAKTGDLMPVDELKFETTCREVILAWLELNVKGNK